MTITAERQMEHIGETCGCAHHDRDLIQELSRRLDCLWRCDQFIANADGHPDLQAFWRDVKQQEKANIERMKELLAGEINQNCF